MSVPVVVEHKDTKDFVPLAISVGLISKMMDRYNQMDDPVIRYTLLIEHLHMLADLAESAFECHYRKEELPADLQLKSLAMVKKLRGELMGLSEYIQQPYLSPDHAKGNRLMKDTEKKFANKSIKKTVLIPLDENE